MTTIKRSQPAADSSTDRVETLIAATTPLLELFAICEDVFTEEKALSEDKRAMTLGRIYRQWKRTRSDLGADDEWNT
jgi:hypothetical protein